MAYICNKGTGVITECLNADIIKVCEKDAGHYLVSEVLEELTKALGATPKKADDQGAPDDNVKKELKDLKVKDLKAMAKELGLTGYSSMNGPELVAAIENYDPNEFDDDEEDEDDE